MDVLKVEINCKFYGISLEVNDLLFCEKSENGWNVIYSKLKGNLIKYKGTRYFLHRNNIKSYGISDITLEYNREENLNNILDEI